MASLYIKDGEANELAERLARERGLTKTAAVKMALSRELERTPTRPSTREVVEGLWKKYPLPTPTGLSADKAFFDEESGNL